LYIPQEQIFHAVSTRKLFAVLVVVADLLLSLSTGAPLRRQFIFRAVGKQSLPHGFFCSSGAGFVKDQGTSTRQEAQ
jgi:hypothetical protein